MAATTALSTPADYVRTEFGRRLRAARTTRGLSLMQIEAQSAGRWKAVVIGAYERGDRAMTVERLHAYAEFLDVQAVDLIPNVNPLREAMYRSAR